MAELRRPVLIAVLAIVVVAIMVELGATLFLHGSTDPTDLARRLATSPEFQALSPGQRAETLAYAGRLGGPPGIAIPYLALVDGILAYNLALMVVGLLLPDRVEGKAQGIVTLILAFFFVLGALVLTLLALVKLVVMVSLFFAAPFGTIAYLAIWGSFDTGGAAVVLSFVMLLNLAAAAGLPIAHQRFLKNKGLIAIVLTVLLSIVIVMFLQGLVPFVMVSITDALAAVIIGVIAIVWGIVILVGSIVAVGMAVTTP
ncbi:MAG: hypothetical protein ACXVSX_10040 [Solirubrobacteraceae bacterium]